MDNSGRKRVFISNILPSVDDGLYPAKTIINEPTLLSADIFADGHDELGACIQIKHADQKTWQDYPMQFFENDRWHYSFFPERLGIYQFKVQAWVDHFATWQRNINKKYSAGQDIAVELQIGVQLVEEAATRTKGKELSAMRDWTKQVLAAGDDSSAAMNIVMDHSLLPLLFKNRDKALVTIHPTTYSLRVDRPKAKFSSWYEMFPRSASRIEGQHGSFNDVKELLPIIANMGFDVLYLPPIHPIGEKNRKGKNNLLQALPGEPGSPWAIGSKDGGHKSINPLLGNLKDFKSLVTACKKQGMEIAMDIALQCAPDHPYVKLHPQWFKWRPDGSVQYAENPPKKYEDILPFNFETDDWQALWEELKSIFDYWIDIGVEIFRVDNPHTKPFAFWEWAIDEIKKEHPQVLFLAEAFTRPRIMEQLAKAGFSQSYTYFTWRIERWEIEEYLTQLTKTNERYYFRPNFWPNTPDILPPHLTTGGENAHIIRVILAATLSSNYGLYGPVYEYGLTEPMPGKEEYIHNEKYEIKNWDWERYSKIKDIMVRINKIRKENQALQDTNNIEFGEGENQKIIAYAKVDKASGNIIIVAINLDPYNTQNGSIKIPLWKFGIHATHYAVTDLISGERYQWNSDWNYVSLNPYEIPAHVLKVEL